MGLDLYVGSFTRYYTGDWETLVEQLAHAGHAVQVIRPPLPDDAITDPAVIAGVVHDWMVALRLADDRGAAWDESPGTPYWTIKPDWDGYWATWFLAARDEFPDLPVPSPISPPSRMPDVTRQPLYQRVDAAYAPGTGFPARYLHLLRPEVWLPIDFDQPFESESINGDVMVFGSVPRLLRDLDLLNARTFRAGAATLRAWAMDGLPEGDPTLEEVARVGLAMLHGAARFGVDHRLPVKLDY